MLTEEEIKQFHNNFRVIRKHKIGDISFTIASFTWEKEGEFVKSFDDFEQKENGIYVSNTIATEIVKGCLVAFDNENKTGEEIENFSSAKINFIVDKYKELSSDIEDYLKGFEPQPLTDEEVGEFILTDMIQRNIKLNFNEETPPIKIRYKILNVKENKKVGKRIQEKVKEKDVKTNVHLEYINENEFILEMVETVNGNELNEDNIKGISVDLIKFILQRAEKLENEIREKLNDSSEIGESLKN
jgi:hypothetical protein